METSPVPTLQIPTDTRPLRLGELFDQAVRLYRRNFFSYVGIVALGYIPYVLILIISSILSVFGLEDITSDPQNIFTSLPYWLSILGNLFAILIYLIFVNGWSAAALTNAIFRSYLGQKTGILEAYQQPGFLWVKLLISLFLFSLITSLVSVWAVVPIIGWFTGFGLLVFLSMVVGELIRPVVILEKLEGFKPISRAWYLARRRFWWLLGFAIALSLFNLFIVAGPTFLASYLTGAILGSGQLSQPLQLLSTVLPTVAIALLALIVLPLQLTAWTLVYFDLRVRTEGFDLALLTLTSSEATAAEISNLSTSTPEQKWMTGDDIGKFTVISLVFFGVVALIFGIFAVTIVGLGSLGGG